MKKLSVSNLVTISILQSLVVRCVSLIFFHYPSLPHFKSQWAQICDTYIPDFPFNIQIVQLRLILIFKIIPKSSPQKQLIQIILNGEIRKSLSLTYLDLYVSNFCVIFWSLKMKTRRAIAWLLDTVNHWFLISMVTYYGYMCNWIMETNAFLEFFSS